ncbi:MAG: aminotransferase, partial [Lachnospiraceae bacterium]|nr:aminotransferase [Lachnospiraceae bacterium]
MSKAFAEMSKEELLTLKEELNKEYSEAKSKGLALNMARGKPSPAQLDLGMEFLNAVNSQSDMLSDGKIDTRNYGELDGIPEAKKLMADIMETRPENVIVCGNASLNIMYDTVSRAYT